MDSITDWVAVREGIEKRNISGKSLQHFSESTLDLIGVHDFDTAHHLMEEITKLRCIGEESNVETDEIPRRFTCSLTQQIMDDPVMAWDGKVYERTAILNHLQSKHVNTSTLYPQRKLRTEIKAYLAKNMQSPEGTTHVTEAQTI